MLQAIGHGLLFTIMFYGLKTATQVNMLDNCHTYDVIDSMLNLKLPSGCSLDLDDYPKPNPDQEELKRVLLEKANGNNRYSSYSLGKQPKKYPKSSVK